MKHIPKMLTLLMMPAVFAACEGDDDLVGVNDCSNLQGNFRATSAAFRGATNTTLNRDFIQEGTAFNVRLNNNRTFETRFAETGATPLVRTGTFQATPTGLTLGNQNLFTGADVGEQRFVCTRLANNRFSLRSTNPVRFDFNRNNAFDAGEEGIFEGEFEVF